jgi:hypothetical protein
MREILGVIGEQGESFFRIQAKMLHNRKQKQLKQRISIGNFLLYIDILDIDLSYLNRMVLSFDAF